MNFKRDIEEVKLKEAFHYMDVDGDGTIDVADLVKLLSIPEEQAKDLLHEACSNDVKNPRSKFDLSFWQLFV
jgi:Ca2+-binding EF-hand superfamily protein